jgi:hypothetical protein
MSFLPEEWQSSAAVACHFVVSTRPRASILRFLAHSLHSFVYQCRYLLHPYRVQSLQSLGNRKKGRTDDSSGLFLYGRGSADLAYTGRHGLVLIVTPAFAFPSLHPKLEGPLFVSRMGCAPINWECYPPQLLNFDFVFPSNLYPLINDICDSYKF